ncbi:KilA-N domain-containing protein [Cylindrospermum sp. FACHB-282]|uniref:KilA-N domain-containing protein n=1 Tax=Cylindrospermum sp. FACHB-282 TaxID=2692794 RepID=UPI001683B323|nr:KilA-N domain-containing protein [Cylindrospermum sp. FACHB-282]MBD2385249.1 KilA-N domain-containing protein [Cylindrospermum sp. FACHB-282]
MSNFESVKITGSEISPWIVERVGQTWVTWVHPIMAVHLASYLDPAFANYVAEVFVRYVTADPHLAADIASRQNTVEGLDIINKAVQERYKFLEGRDWHYVPFLLGRAEMNYCYKKYQLPVKTFTPISRYLDLFSNYDVIPDFFKDRYPGVYRTIKALGTIQEDHYFLLGYFKEEIDAWVRERIPRMTRFK